MMSRTEEDFELELRSLPGVLNVGITKHANGDVNVVTLIANSKDPLATRSAAIRSPVSTIPKRPSSLKTRIVRWLTSNAAKVLESR